MSVGPEDFSLAGKVAVVTGANTGIGQAIAVGLARAGARVALAGRSDMTETGEMIGDAGMPAVRAKSVALTEFAIALSDEWLAPLGVEVASPRAAAERGGHVTLSHPSMREVVATLWEQDVIPDYRDPGGLRVGLSPLSTSFEETFHGMAAVREALRAIRAREAGLA